MNDMSKTIAPKSDQLNYDDFIGTRTKDITVTKVKVNENDKEQPAIINFEGDNGKPYKPCKSMRRVLVEVWGGDGNKYVGKSMTLYGDPTVQWGGQPVGGIRISHMSHIDKPKPLSLTVTRGRRSTYVIKPLKADIAPKDDEFDDEGDMPDTSEEILVLAMIEANKGMDDYKHFFTNLTDAEKKPLVDSGNHDKLKVLAQTAVKDDMPFE